jgi:hypothetical protein
MTVVSCRLEESTKKQRRKGDKKGGGSGGGNSSSSVVPRKPELNVRTWCLSRMRSATEGLWQCCACCHSIRELGLADSTTCCWAVPCPEGAASCVVQSVRVVQRNLVYVVGLAMDICYEDVLRGSEFFGQFGKPIKVSMQDNFCVLRTACKIEHA